VDDCLAIGPGWGDAPYREQPGVLPLERVVRRYRRQPHRLDKLARELGISAQVIVDRRRDLSGVGVAGRGTGQTYALRRS